jgi:hypothetical protein
VEHDDSDDSSSDEELNAGFISFNSKIIQNVPLPYEPKLFPLVFNGTPVNYGIESLTELE